MEDIVSLIVDIPVEFRSDFKADAIIAWQSYGDRPQQSKFSYFEDRQAIYDMVDKDRPNPFNAEALSFDPGFVCVDDYYRFIHIDLSVSEDAAGIAMCHVPDWIIGSKSSVDSSSGEKELRPIFWIDFMGRFKAPRGGEIIFESIREVIYEIDRRGFPILLITYDRFQSVDSIQLLRSRGYIVSNLSLDRTSTYPVIDIDAKDSIKRISTGSGKFSNIAAWSTGKHAINSRRVRLPFYLPISDTFVGEDVRDVDDFGKALDHTQYITQVQKEALFAYYDDRAIKVKEGPKGSIDLLEAVVGAIFNASTNVTGKLEVETGVEKRKRLAEEMKGARTEFERQEIRDQIDEDRGGLVVDEIESESIFEED